MINVTITLEPNVASWARILAAKRGISLSRLVGEMLKEKMAEEDGYLVSMKHYLSQSPSLLKKPGTLYPDREELYERKRIR